MKYGLQQARLGTIHRILGILIIALILFAKPASAQTPLPTTEPIATEAVTEAAVPSVETVVAPQPDVPLLTNPIVIQPDVGNNTMVMMAFITAIIGMISVAYMAKEHGKSNVEILRLSIPQGVQGVIGSEPISQWVERRLGYLPNEARDIIYNIADAYDPATNSTVTSLAQKVALWVKNVTDADPTTGAVIVETADPEMTPNPPVG